MSEAVLVYPRVLACPRCGVGLGAESLAEGGDTVCPGCRTTFRATLFPQFFRENERAVARVVRATEGEASCFFHPENAAARACDQCGRFVCNVCEIKVGSRVVCANCLSVGITDPKKSQFVAWRFLWGDAALLTGLLPFVFGIFIWPLLVLTIPTTFFLAIYGWNRPSSITRGPRHAAAIIGMLCALGQAGVFAFLILAITGNLIK